MEEENNLMLLIIVVTLHCDNRRRVSITAFWKLGANGHIFLREYLEN